MSFSFRSAVRSSLLLAAIPLAGCHRFKPAILTHYVYVTAKSTFLRDRIAAVSNRTGNVENGQKLEILEENRRFYKVRTEKGEVGWIDQRAVATEDVMKSFEDLNQKHAHDPSVASGVVRDDVYLHNIPGRKTDRMFRLQEGDKLKLLARASTLKPLPPGTLPTGAPVNGKPGDPAAPPPPPPMEDWWLVRDTHGHTGWMLGRMLDVDVPDSIARYAEGQRIVGAYVLHTVTDPEIEGAVKEVPEYVCVLSPYKSGLPYDFNQLRVFYWNVKKHRYETANRDRNIMGYLPVKVGTDAGTINPQRGTPFTGPAPSYTYTVLAAGVPVPQPDPETGMLVPPRNHLITKIYRLEGNNTRRVLPPGVTPPAEAQAEPKEEKKDKSSVRKSASRKPSAHGPARKKRR